MAPRSTDVDDEINVMAARSCLVNELSEMVSRIHFTDADIQDRRAEILEATLHFVFECRDKEDVHGAGVAVGTGATGAVAVAESGAAWPVPGGQSRM